MKYALNGLISYLDLFRNPDAISNARSFKLDTNVVVISDFARNHGVAGVFSERRRSSCSSIDLICLKYSHRTRNATPSDGQMRYFVDRHYTCDSLVSHIVFMQYEAVD